MHKADKLALKRAAHHLKPVVWVGQNGLTDAVMIEIERALAVHQLIKIKLAGNEKEDRNAMREQIEAHCEATTVQQVGATLSLYRRNPEKALISALQT